MGSAVWQALGVAEAKVGEWMAEAKAAVTGLSGKLTTVLTAEKALEPAVVSGVELVFEDLEALLKLTETATAGQGVNFPADSAGYAGYLKLMADVKAVAPQVEAALKAIETV